MATGGPTRIYGHVEVRTRADVCLSLPWEVAGLLM